MDISADLTELSRTPVLVVCAGAKSILDLPLTLEVLETQSVPVIGYGTDELPAFYVRESGLRLAHRAAFELRPALRSADRAVPGDVAAATGRTRSGRRAVLAARRARVSRRGVCD